MRQSYGIGMGRIDPAHLAEWQNVLFAQICINLYASASTSMPLHQSKLVLQKYTYPAMQSASRVKFGVGVGGGGGEGGREYW